MRIATSAAAEISVTAMKGRCSAQKEPPDSHIVHSRASPARATAMGAIQRGRGDFGACGKGGLQRLPTAPELSLFARMTAIGEFC